MDDGIEVIKSDCPWQHEDILDDQYLLRRIAANKRESGRNHKFPGASHFALREEIGEKSLSFNWNKYANEKESYTLVGLTHDRNGNFIDYSVYVFFTYPVDFIKSIPRFERIEHSPEWYGNPSEVGRPNNKSHASLFCGDFNIATRSVLSLYCQNNEKSYLKFKLKTIRDEIEDLKARHNNTPYHKDWKF